MMAILKNTGEYYENLPNNWKFTKIKHTINRYTNGAWGSEPKNNKDDIVCIRIADFDYSKGILKDVDYTIRNIKLNDNLTLKNGDLLIEKSGGGENQPVGRVIYYNKDFKSTFSNFITKMEIKEEYNSKFICYVFRMLYNLNVNTKSIKQTTGIQNLDSYSYFNETIITPPLDEQEQIAKYLDNKTTKIQQTITKNKKLITLLKEKRTTLINQTVTKGLNPNTPMKETGIEWIGKIPEHWDIIKIKYCTELENKKIINNQFENYIGLEHIESKTGKIIDNNVEEVDSSVNSFSKNNILFGKLRPYLSKVARPSFNGACSSEILVYKVNNNLSKNYLYYLMLSNGFIDYVNSMTYGVKMPRANPNQINNTKIPLSNIEEQEQISNYLDNQTSKIDKTIEKVERNIELLEEYKESLIHHVVTGKIDVRGVEV